MLAEADKKSTKSTINIQGAITDQRYRVWLEGKSNDNHHHKASAFILKIFSFIIIDKDVKVNKTDEELILWARK